MSTGTVSSHLRRSLLAVPGARPAYFAVRRTGRRAQTKRMVKDLLESGQPIKLDIGGGNRRGEQGWLTLDTAEGCDLFWNLIDGIPFPDNCVAQIYSSHLLEHLTVSEALAVLRECHRVLIPGGGISATVPNARLYVDIYLGHTPGNAEIFDWEPGLNPSTAIDALNYVAYMAGEHRQLFDIDQLVWILIAAGFADASARAFDPTMDQLERDCYSIYASAHKPIFIAQPA
ncbi:MAG: class I SAM-dependent methyltransferase, partial [Actinomycetales bacterium]